MNQFQFKIQVKSSYAGAFMDTNMIHVKVVVVAILKHETVFFLNPHLNKQLTGQFCYWCNI